MNHVDSVDAKFGQKLDVQEAQTLLDEKLDSKMFMTVFPANKSASDTLKNLIKTETEAFNERAINMIKLWDQKISNLRSELNVSAIYKKMGTFPRKDEVND